MGKFIDLTGQEFANGNIKVIERAPDYILPSGEKKVMWKCKCICGNDFIMSGKQLRKGTVKSCGCKPKGRFIDLTGMTFDRLTVIKRAEDHISPKGKPTTMWECECECGNKTIVSRGNLRNHITKSCGCNKLNNFNDLTGKKIGRLTIIERVENYLRPNGQTIIRWRCKCDCGNETIIESSALNRKNPTQSCGCLAREESSKRAKKYNKYDLSGDYGIGYTANGEEFWFDKEDYDLIKDYYWYLSKKKNGYAIAYIPNIKKKMFLQRLIMNPPKEMCVDHINHNKLDNRKQNLRIVTIAQNNLNRVKLPYNTSGTTGVWYVKEQKKWQAGISVNKKKINLGTFINKEDAIKARKEAEEKYFGEYSYDNSMKGDEK